MCVQNCYACFYGLDLGLKSQSERPCGGGFRRKVNSDKNMPHPGFDPAKDSFVRAKEWETFPPHDVALHE